jgi:tripeptide aminopeptidase
MPHEVPFDREAAVSRLLRFLSIEGVTGQERAIAEDVRACLIEVGVPAHAIRYDDANQRLPLPTQTGNLIVDLPGTRPGPRLLFMTHLDTVPLASGARPVIEGDRIVAAGPTALGGDNRTGVAALVQLAATLIAERLPHPPLTLLFTVREESGLFGAKHLNPDDLGSPVMGFNVDGKLANEVTIAAVGAERWEIEIAGKAAHAGVHPERGISAIMVASVALANVYRDGWFGKVRRADGREGTSNVGSIGDREGRAAGQATNVVTDYVRLTGESRSHDPNTASAITQAYKDAFLSAASMIQNDEGATATVNFQSRLDYYPFRLPENSPVVRHTQRVIESLGSVPILKIGNGGLDANWIVRHGIPTVTIGAGQNAIHTIDEWVDLVEFEKGCRTVIALATTELSDLT